MSLLEILACPRCKARVLLEDRCLRCHTCGQAYPIVKGVPVMLPDAGVPNVQHEAELQLRGGYDPWVHRVVLQSLLDHQVALEIGAGNMQLDDPCIIRMDVQLTPYADLVADAHALPFLPGSLDYIFSLAVVEHLRNPFAAARSMFETLKDGGYVYHECNFVFAYHGYPHHYFNATSQGLREVFGAFQPLRQGVATYQMPSFALQMVLGSYLKHSRADQHPHGRRLTALLRQVLDKSLTEYDIYFSEEEALNVAAGTYFAGMKRLQPDTTLIPAVILEAWRSHRDLRERFPEPERITTADNILIWARREGRARFPEIAAYLDQLEPFNKRGARAPWDRSAIRSLPVVEARFGAMGFDVENSMEANAAFAEARAEGAPPPATSLLKKGLQALGSEGLSSAARKASRYLARKLRS